MPISRVEGVLWALGNIASELLSLTEAGPGWFGGSWSKATRRRALDVAAWSRDVIYNVVGHTAGVVKVSAPPARSGRPPIRTRSLIVLNLKRRPTLPFSVRARRRNVNRYLELYASDRGAAERLLSSTFRANSRFSIA